MRRARVRARLAGRWFVGQMSHTRGRMFALAILLIVGSAANMIAAWKFRPPLPLTAAQSHAYHMRELYSLAFYAVGIAIIMIELQQRQRDKHLDRGLCPVCGYDLRATPVRCPECGTVIAEYRRS